MTEAEKNIIARFLEDVFMVETVKKVLSQTNEKLLSEHEVNRLSNEDLGAYFRANAVAKETIKMGFEEMENYRQGKEKSPQVNDAR